MRFIAPFSLVLVLLTGCGDMAPLLGVSTTDPHSELSAVRYHPIGPDKYMISCVDSQSYCTDLATRLCGVKYNVISSWVNNNDYGRTTMVVKCAE